jgi:hypothetical protein
MKKDWRVERASDENEKENAWDETFKHFDQHEQSDIGIQKSRAMKRDWRAESASEKNNNKTKV